MKNCFFVFCVLFLFLGVAYSRVWYNSQIKFEDNFGIADLNNDGIDDFHMFDGDRVYVTSTNFEAIGMGYGKFHGPITRTFTGKFLGPSVGTMLCAQEVWTNGYHEVDCWTLNSNRYFSWWLYQGDFIGSNDIIVGDFNGDERDDILTYNPSTGAAKIFRCGSDGLFAEETSWNTIALQEHKNVQIRAGRLRLHPVVEIITYIPALGIFRTYYWTQNPTSGQWYLALYSTIYTEIIDQEFALADLNGDGKEDLVLHDFVNGPYLFYYLDDENILPLDINHGQLYQGPYSRVFWCKLHSYTSGWNYEQNNRRDDSIAFSYYYYPTMWIRSDAWYDSLYQFTYVWKYTQFTVKLYEDQDGDAIIAKYELGGYDADNNGISDNPLFYWGASPLVRDVFVQVDYMTAAPGNTYDYSFQPDAISIAVNSFAQKGINLHILTGNQIQYQSNIGNPTLDWKRDFDPIKNAHFSPTRVPFFHYCLFAAAYGGTTSSGISRGIIGSDFIVSLGHFSKPTVYQQAGTFLHELGHNLGLRHGGSDHVNYKPNYISIMNYNYQFTGIVKAGSTQFLYSEITCQTIDENYLFEYIGIQCETTVQYQTLVKSPTPERWATVNNPFDFDRNGVIGGGLVGAITTSVDLNNDGLKTQLMGSDSDYSALKFYGIGITSKRDEVTDDEDIHISPCPSVEDNIPTSPETFRTDFSEMNLQPHNGTQVLTATKNYPDIFSDELQARIGPSAEEIASSAIENAELYARAANPHNARKVPSEKASKGSSRAFNHELAASYQL